MHTEDNLLPLSALQHLMFCERQCALIHVEQAWSENRFTAEGKTLHDKVDQGAGETRGDIRIARGLPLRSLQYGLVGKADVVEFHARQPFPVEYKRGRPKRDLSDEVQLCAQAFCLEEMLNKTVPAGALFYGKTRRRKDVPFDPSLRQVAESAIERLHILVEGGVVPPGRFEKKCESCSLLDRCMPARGGEVSAGEYVREAFDAL